MRLRKEEYATIGDFIKTSFVRDQAIISQRFPKLNAEFITKFTQAIEAVKVMNSKVVLTQEQKTAVQSLYAETTTLYKELGFLNSYITSAGLISDIVRNMKTEINKGNMESAIAKIEDLRQFIINHLEILEQEGMITDFPEILEDHKTSLTQKIAFQNEIMNVSKTHTPNNLTVYDELYNMMLKVSEAGKLVFDNTVTEDEYVISKVISRMRGPKQNQENMVN